MKDIAEDRWGNVNPGSLGMYIAKHERRIEFGKRFEKNGESHKVSLWRVVEIATQQPENGGNPSFDGGDGLGGLTGLPSADAGNCQGDSYGKRGRKDPPDPSDPPAAGCGSKGRETAEITLDSRCRVCGIGSLPAWPLRVFDDDRIEHETCPPPRDRKRLAEDAATRARSHAHTRG